MASAPPVESMGPVGQVAPPPPSYEETMTVPPYPPGAHMPPPHPPGAQMPPPHHPGAQMPPYPPGAQMPPYPPGAQMPPPPVYSKAPSPPNPGQGYTQVYSPPPAPAGPGASVVTVQTVYVQPGMVFGDLPVQVYCPNCAQSVLTRLEYSSGTMTWLTCAGLFIFGCIYGCCLIPFCVDNLKDVMHHCPNCTRVLGVFKRL